jgi:hypothetical protein
MAKNHRVELRLNDEDYERLRQRAESFQTTMTGAVESLLRISAPVALFNVRDVGVRGRRRVSVRFSSGMVVHGFLWSRGRQLLAPRVRVRGRYVPIVQGSKEFWHLLREAFEQKLARDGHPWDVEPNRDLELAGVRLAAL